MNGRNALSLQAYQDVAQTLRRLADGGQHRIGASLIRRGLIKANSEAGLAISGGVDSMALASICSEVTRRDSTVTRRLLRSDDFSTSRIAFTAFIVDHKLRDNSSEEAHSVSEELSRLGIPSNILPLVWTTQERTFTTKLESLARRKRYQALGLACRDHGINSLLLAHHADDQAETVLARAVSRYTGSGLQGMRAEAPIPECEGLYGADHSGSRDSAPDEQRKDASSSMLIEQGGVTILRPLLESNKADLVSICEQNHVRSFEDPTNAIRTFTLRNTIRSLLKADCLPLALRKPRLLALAKTKMKASQAADEWATKAFRDIQPRLKVGSGEARFVVPASLKLCTTSWSGRARLVRQMIDIVTPAKDVPLQSLYGAVEVVFGSSEKQQCVREVQVAAVQIYVNWPEEPNSNPCVVQIRRTMPTKRERETVVTRLVPTRSGHESESAWQLWDGRYWIRVWRPRGATSSPELTVRFLDPEDLAVLRQSLDKKECTRMNKGLKLAPGDTRFTCPVIVAKAGSASQPEIVTLPSLGWSRPGWKRIGGAIDRDTASWCWDIRYKHVDINTNAVTSSAEHQ